MKEKKLEITDENYDGYHLLNNIKNGVKNGKFYGTNKQIIILFFITGVLELSCFVVPYLVFPSHMLGVLSVLIATSFVLFGFNKILSKISFRNFKKYYPDIDINIDKEELKKELVKYEELSKVEKDFEMKKEEHLSNYQASFRSMTPSEKIAFLEKEKEFWEQEQILEKYTSPELDIYKKLGEKKI